MNDKEALENLIIKLLQSPEAKRSRLISSIESFFSSDQSDFDAGVTITLDNGTMFDLVIIEKNKE